MSAQETDRDITLKFTQSQMDVQIERIAALEAALASLQANIAAEGKRARAATCREDWSELPDDALIPAVPLLRELADTLLDARYGHLPKPGEADGALVLVPREPTEAMVDASCRELIKHDKFDGPPRERQRMKHRIRIRAAIAAALHSKGGSND